MLTGVLGFVGGLVVYRLFRGKNLLTNDSGWISTPSALGWVLIVILSPVMMVVHGFKKLMGRA